MTGNNQATLVVDAITSLVAEPIHDVDRKRLMPIQIPVNHGFGIHFIDVLPTRPGGSDELDREFLGVDRVPIVDLNSTTHFDAASDCCSIAS